MKWPEFLFYSTPSQVTIVSRSLFFVAALVYIVAVGVPVYSGITNESYLESVKPEARMNTFSSIAAYNAYNPDLASLSYCDPTRTEYEEAGWKFSYRNNKCKRFRAEELHYKTSNEIFVRTYRQISEVDEETGRRTTTNYFAVGAEFVQIPFNLHYFTYQEKESSPPVTIFSHTGAVYREFGKGETVKLSVQEWLDCAGVSLDSYNTAIPTTVTTGNVQPFPLRRMTGLKIYLQVDFTKDGGSGKATIKTEVGDEWTTMGDDLDFYSPTSYVNTYDSAILFRFQYGGRIGYFNISYFFIWLAVISVLATRANLVINYIAMYGPFMNRAFNRRIMKTKISAERELARNMAHMVMNGVQNNCFDIKFENPLYIKRHEVIRLIDVVYGYKHLVMNDDGTGYMRTKTGRIPFDRDMVADNANNLTTWEIEIMTDLLFEGADNNRDGKLSIDELTSLVTNDFMTITDIRKKIGLIKKRRDRSVAPQPNQATPLQTLH